MTTAVKERGEVAISEAGDDVVLRLSNRDHKELQAKHGKQWMMIFINDMQTGNIDVDLMEEIARLAAKNRKGEPVKLAEDAFDKLTVLDFGKRVMDAVTMSVHGQTFEEFVTEQAKKLQEAAEGADTPPLLSPDTTTSTISEESATGPASE